jgi:hypothetical protein
MSWSISSACARKESASTSRALSCFFRGLFLPLCTGLFLVRFGLSFPDIADGGNARRRGDRPGAVNLSDIGEDKQSPICLSIQIESGFWNNSYSRGNSEPRGRGTRPGLKISAMIAATVTAAAATAGVIQVSHWRCRRRRRWRLCTGSE